MRDIKLTLDCDIEYCANIETKKHCHFLKVISSSNETRECSLFNVPIFFDEENKHFIRCSFCCLAEKEYAAKNS